MGRGNHEKGDNPYKRTYMNGGESRRSRSLSSISAESAASDSETNPNAKWRREVGLILGFSHIRHILYI